MTSIKRIFAKIWLVTFVILALGFAFSYFKTNRSDISRILDADLRVLAIAAAAQVFYFIATVLTWQNVLISTTQKTVKFWEGLSHILLVNFGKYIPGKIWGLAARGTRLRELGYSLNDVVRSSIVEQFLLIACGIWLALLGATVAFDNPIFLLFLLLLTPIIFLYRHGSNLMRKVTSRYPGLAAIERLFDMNIRTARLFGLSTGFIWIWLLLTITFAFFCQSIFPVAPTIANFATLLLALTASFLAGFAAIFAPGGFGVREGVGAAILSSLVTLEEAVLLMLLFRVWVIAWELSAGAIMLVGFTGGIRGKKSKVVGK